MQEQAKYEAMWAHEQYREFSPGAVVLPKFLEVANPKAGATVRDLGCGSGRVGKALADLGLNVTQYDFAANCRDPGIDLPFVLHDLTKPVPGKPADFGYCSDVMEHLPRKDVQKALFNVVTAARRVFLQISTVDDHMGALIGEPLHLTVEPYEWWKERLEKLDCRIIWSEVAKSHCLFYVTAFADAAELSEIASLNVTHETVQENVLANLAAGYAEVAPHVERDDALLMLAGGPSLVDHEEEIIRRRKAGEFLVTTNGTYNWCLERGIEPSIQIVCDAREFNNRFVQPALPRCLYLIASQCHPSVAASLPKDQVLIWHSGNALADLIEKFDRDRGEHPRTWFPIFGGSTVMLRAFPLLMLLGFRKFECFGFDSCVRVDGETDTHHAYAQPENDHNHRVPVMVGGREFSCQPWMAAQAGDFVRMQKMLAPHIDLIVHGDGLIAHIIQTAAED